MDLITIWNKSEGAKGLMIFCSFLTICVTLLFVQFSSRSCVRVILVPFLPSNTSSILFSTSTERPSTSFSDFLQEVALLTDLDSDDDKEQPKVSLMTIHAAKGLEFPTVFVVGLEENIFPSPMCVNTMRELEEERRLLYVAITRAEKHCILTCAQNRFRYGRMEFDTPSRFIKDFDPSLLKVEGNSGLSGISSSSSHTSQSVFSSRTSFSRPVQNPRPVATQFMADPKRRIVPIRQETPRPQSAIGNIGLKEGDVIEHQRFGMGTVIKVEGTGENTKATVEFKNAGIKQLLLKFAKYTIVR